MNSIIETSNDFTIEDLGIQEEWVYDIEVDDNHNFFANDILVHNSAYVCLEPILKSKYGENYESEQSQDTLVEACDAIMKKLIHPKVDEHLRDNLSYCLNSYQPEKLQLDREIIADRFISIAPKMYYCRIQDSEGTRLTKPKLKVTGLSVKKSTTPQFSRDHLVPAMEKIIDGDIPAVIKYFDKVRTDMKSAGVKDLSINVNVNSVDYELDEETGKYFKWAKCTTDEFKKTGKRYKKLSAPINSRAAIMHNELIQKYPELNIQPIEGGKASYIFLKTPNLVGSNVIAFQNPAVFDIPGLVDSIDYSLIFDKTFKNNLELITNPLGISLDESKVEIDDEEW